MPQLVLFDFFGVISSEIAPYWLAENVADEAEALKAGLIHAADRGDVDEADLFRQLGARAGKSGARVRDEWRALARIDPAMVELVAATGRRRRVSLLSNCPAPFLREILRAHNLERLFEVIIISAEVGMAKPEAEIFRFAAERHALRADEILFIDDNPNNVAAASAVGMASHLFAGRTPCAAWLETELERR